MYRYICFDAENFDDHGNLRSWQPIRPIQPDPDRQLDELGPLPPLPAPDLYAHELISNGGGVWLGCIEQGICEQSHTPGETGDEVRHYYMASSVLKLLAAQREQMIADGWRQTRYVAPVTDCEACLTPDACAIRGQCAHYLRERA